MNIMRISGNLWIIPPQPRSAATRRLRETPPKRHGASAGLRSVPAPVSARAIIRRGCSQRTRVAPDSALFSVLIGMCRSPSSYLQVQRVRMLIGVQQLCRTKETLRRALPGQYPADGLVRMCGKLRVDQGFRAAPGSSGPNRRNSAFVGVSGVAAFRSRAGSRRKHPRSLPAPSERHATGRVLIVNKNRRSSPANRRVGCPRCGSGARTPAPVPCRERRS